MEKLCISQAAGVGTCPALGLVDIIAALPDSGEDASELFDLDRRALSGHLTYTTMSYTANVERMPTRTPQDQAMAVARLQRDVQGQPQPPAYLERMNMAYRKLKGQDSTHPDMLKWENENLKSLF